jgi:hypothetical protein
MFQFRLLSYVALTIIALATSGKASRHFTLSAKDLPVAGAAISSGAAPEA